METLSQPKLLSVCLAVILVSMATQLKALAASKNQDSEPQFIRTRRSAFLLNEDHSLPVFPTANRRGGNYIRFGRAAMQNNHYQPTLLKRSGSSKFYARYGRDVELPEYNYDSLDMNFEKTADKRDQSKHYIRFRRSVDKILKGQDVLLNESRAEDNVTCPEVGLKPKENRAPKRYIRFGRALENVEDLEKLTPKQYVLFGKNSIDGDLENDDKRAPKQYVRFGRNFEDVDSEYAVKRAPKQYVRFGRNSEDVASENANKRAPKQYVRFGRNSIDVASENTYKRAPKQYVRFGRNSEAVDLENADKRAPKQYVRFGRNSEDVDSENDDKRAPKQYVRFGRSIEEIEDSSETEASLGLLPVNYFSYDKDFENEDKRAPKQYVRFGRDFETEISGVKSNTPHLEEVQRRVSLVQSRNGL